MYNVKEWKHIFKLDPNKVISDQDLDRVCTSGTDAVIIGGTDGVTFDKVVDLVARVHHYDIPCIFEVSNLEALTPGFDLYFVPMVMNSKEKKWMLDVQHQAVKEYGDFMDWEAVIVEGYCVLNEEAKVFKHTNCTYPDWEDVVAYARMAEHMFHLPVFYLEYSGVFGNSALVQQVSEELENTTLLYGGGIRSKAEAEEMAAVADVIIVGNVIYDDIEAALQTVGVAKN